MGNLPYCTKGTLQPSKNKDKKFELGLSFKAKLQADKKTQLNVVMYSSKIKKNNTFYIQLARIRESVYKLTSCNSLQNRHGGLLHRPCSRRGQVEDLWSRNFSTLFRLQE